MRAILINPKDRSVEEVDYDASDYKNITKLLGCDLFTIAGYMNEGKHPHPDALAVDDEGLCKHFDASDMFQLMIDGVDYQPFVGRGLIMGSDGEGGDAPAITTLQAVRNAVRFARNAP